MTSINDNPINNEISKRLLVSGDIKLSEYVLRRANDIRSMVPHVVNTTLHDELENLILELDTWDAMSDENREDIYCKTAAEQTNDQKTPELKKYDECLNTLKEIQSADEGFDILSDFITYDVLGPLRGYVSDNGLFVNDDVMSLSFEEFCGKTRDDILSSIATKEFEIGVDAVNVERANEWIDNLHKLVHRLEMA